MATPLGFVTFVCCMTFSKNAATFLQIMLEIWFPEIWALFCLRGIAASTCDDLTPFLADGTVTANLPRFLENTAKIEIGPWTARAGLISAAILLCVPCGKTPPPRAFSSEVDTGSHQENAIKQRARVLSDSAEFESKAGEFSLGTR